MSGSDYTLTPNLGLYKPNYALDVGRWGEHLNLNSDVIDARLGAEAINVKGFGAIGDGVTDDTVAINTAANAIPETGGVLFFPKGTYSISATILLKSLTRMVGDGCASVIAANAGWTAGTTYQLVMNRNYSVTTITDHDIVIENMAFDYTHAPAMGPGAPAAPGPGGAYHCVHFHMARNIQVRNCRFQGDPTLANDATAMTACDTTLVEGCVAYDFHNCFYDHWWNPQNARVINCFARGPTNAVFFNPEGGAVLGPGYAARNIVVSGNTFIATTTGLSVCQFEPLSTGNTVSGVVCTGNTFTNVALAFRGATSGAIISDNVFLGMTDSPVLQSVTAFSGTPTGIVVANNTIVAPLVPSGNSVIVVNVDDAIISGNSVTGTSYGSTNGIETSNKAVVIGNSISNNKIYAINASSGTEGLSVRNGQSIGWRDASGGLSRISVGSDNHMVWFGTNASGADRVLMDMFQRSNSSFMAWSVPVLFATVGFNGATPGAKPTVSGAKGGNAALASLLTALAAYGLVTDTTT
jgi:hypothetical protein